MAEERELEQHRLNNVAQEIDKQLQKAETFYDKAHSETRAVESNYIANTSINTAEVDDAMETNAEIQQQRNIVARVTETENIMAKTVTTLKLLRTSPYFGRVDIIEDNWPETLYIGLASLQDETGDFLIYDWRAPISGIYYNGTLGKVSYPTPSGEQTVDLQKKRQFVIHDGQITSMFDTNETVGDEMLQYALGQQNDDVMRNIVATIQQEQNQIIRDTTSDLLVVQGVAGSGKTSAILQRIAFLLFHSREELNSDQIVLFSPNRLFSSYIADVLPSLGERNMRQVTLAEFFSARLQGLTVQTLFDRYEQEQHFIGHASYSVRQELESEQIVSVIDDYIAQLSTNDIHFFDIYYEDKIFFGAQEFQTYLATIPTSYTIRERISQLQKHFMQVLTDRIESLQDADWVLTELDNLTDQEYQNLIGDDDLEETLVSENEDTVISLVAKRYLTKQWQVIDDALYNNFYLDIYQQYRSFLQYVTEQKIDEQSEWWQAKQRRFDLQLEYHRIDLEDAAPLLFLRDRLTGGGINQAMSYVFIDEMQDYAMAQLLYLKHAFPKAKFTVLGDSEQALFRQVETPQTLLNKYAQGFDAQKPALIKLNRAYRSTHEIMNFAKALLPDGNDIMTFTRHGEKPILRQAYPDTSVAVLNDEVAKLRQSFQTVAILTKTAEQAELVLEALRRYPEKVQLLHAMDRTRTANVLVMPIYLAKGLEFDAVIGYDVSQNNYPDDKAIGLLYTLASRAMHALHLVTVGPVSPLIIQVQNTLASSLLE
ncbi:RNA polymerase recycling motor HelD [Weissella hellenica]|uniref:AAA family ATPase n=1 Tax=Weissella hellenica TaxID=46256 RepID=A0A4Y4G7M7_WEIHE|nr:RNA polymerase recycling motor HelD [Weissella hellenica]NKY66995.1 AAA family ATPase [Weissella hellenica]GED35930.1 DNA helicase [Weissella hellenica]SCB90662.1 DNA helicase IV [Weissella hellenica]